MDFLQGAPLGAIAAQVAVQKAYLGAETSPVAQGGLARIADQVSQAAIQVDQIASMLQGISVGIHGPRPEPVNGQAGGNTAHPDSLSSRVQNLLASIDRLQRSYESIVR